MTSAPWRQFATASISQIDAMITPSLSLCVNINFSKYGTLVCAASAQKVRIQRQVDARISVQNTLYFVFGA
jgi:hypothetical protein